jgi:hypothetical protein
MIPEDHSLNRNDGQLAEIKYAESLRSADQQRVALAELRSRTGLLISASTISTSFLGSVAAKGNHGFPLEFLWAVIPFGISIVLTLFVVVPLPGWRFDLDLSALRGLADEPKSSLLRTITDLRDQQTILNQRRIDRMSKFFGVAVLALVWSIVAWITVIT